MGLRFCRSNTGASSGKLYAECKVSKVQGDRNVTFGLATEDVSLTRERPFSAVVGNIPAVGGVQVGVGRKGGCFLNGTKIKDIPTTASVNSILAVSVDLSTGAVGLFLNGTRVVTATLPLGQTYYLVVGVEAECEATVNMIQDVPFAYAPPAGFTDWDGNSVPSTNVPNPNLSVEVV